MREFSIELWRYIWRRLTVFPTYEEWVRGAYYGERDDRSCQ